MQDQAKILAEYLSQFPAVEKIILFGSRARGDAEPRSDIDLAISAPSISNEDWHKITAYLNEPPSTLLKVDVVRLEQASTKLQEVIKSQGALLYERR